jgi:hypothetical protein
MIGSAKEKMRSDFYSKMCTNIEVYGSRTFECCYKYVSQKETYKLSQKFRRKCCERKNHRDLRRHKTFIMRALFTDRCNRIIV